MSKRAVRHSEETTALRSADPIRNFTLTVDERIRALTIGAPAWAARKRRIEDELDRLTRVLVELHTKLVEKGHAEEEVAGKINAAAAAFDLRRVNELIVLHNRYYPIEANLPMDRASGAYLVYGKPWRPEEPVTAERLLELARAELAAP